MTRCLINPLALFWAVWVIVVALYLGGVSAGMFSPPEPVLWAAVLLSVGGFSLGYLTWSAFQPLAPPAASHAKALTPERIIRALRLTGLMGLIALALALYRITLIASSLGISLRDLLGAPALLRIGFAGFVTAGVFQANWVVMLNSITSALFSTGFVLLGILLYIDMGRRKYLYLFGFLLVGIVSGLTSVSRYEATVNILYLVFAYCFVHACLGGIGKAEGLADGSMVSAKDHRSTKLARNRRAFSGVLLALAAVGVLFLVIDLLLRKSAEYGQPDRLRGFTFHLYWYLTSPLAAFNELLTTFDGHRHLGQYTFFPLYKWLWRLHLAPQADISVFGEFVFVPYVANTYTWLRNFYEDFGLPGVVVAPYALGWAAAALKTRAVYFPCLNLYVMLLVFILFSFYNYFLVSNQVYLQALFGFLFFRYALPVPEAPGVSQGAGRG